MGEQPEHHLVATDPCCASPRSRPPSAKLEAAHDKSSSCCSPTPTEKEIFSDGLSLRRGMAADLACRSEAGSRERVVFTVDRPVHRCVVPSQWSRGRFHPAPVLQFHFGRCDGGGQKSTSSVRRRLPPRRVRRRNRWTRRRR